MPPENKPTSQKVQKCIDKMNDPNDPASQKLRDDFYAAVDAIAAAANVQALSDSEKAEVVFYIGSKMQSRTVI